MSLNCLRVPFVGNIPDSQGFIIRCSEYEFTTRMKYYVPDPIVVARLQKML